MAYIVMVYLGMAYIVTAYKVMAYIGTAYKVMANVVMAYIAMAYIYMAYTVMILHSCCRYSYGPYGCASPVLHTNLVCSSRDPSRTLLCLLFFGAWFSSLGASCSA